MHYKAKQQVNKYSNFYGERKTKDGNFELPSERVIINVARYKRKERQ